MNWFSSPRVSLRSRLLLHRRQAWPSLSRRCNRGSQLGGENAGTGRGTRRASLTALLCCSRSIFRSFFNSPPCADLSLSRARSLPKKKCTRSFLCYRSTLRSVAKHMLTNHPKTATRHRRERVRQKGTREAGMLSRAERALAYVTPLWLERYTGSPGWGSMSRFFVLA